MEFNNARLAERILLVFEKHDYNIKQFSKSMLMAPSTVRSCVSGVRPVNVDLVHRLFVVHTNGYKEKRQAKITKALFDVLFSETYKDESLWIVIQSKLRPITNAQISLISDTTYDTYALSRHLYRMREYGLKIPISSMAMFDFAPTGESIRGYEQLTRSLTAKYFFGFLLMHRYPVNLWMQIMHPANMAGAGIFTDTARRVIESGFHITDKKRKELKEAARAKRQPF